MWLPLSKPGGSFVASRNAINDMQNQRAQRKYNEVKADWANTTIPAQAYSQMAYANAVAPQFMAKLLQDPKFLGNISPEQASAIKNAVLSGATKPPGFNSLNQMPSNAGNENPGMGNAFNQSPAGQLWRGIKNLLGKHGTDLSSNPAQQQNMPQPEPQQGGNAFQQPPQPSTQATAPAANETEADIFNKYIATPEGQAEVDKANRGEPSRLDIGTEALAHELANEAKNASAPGNYLENASKGESIIEEGKASGKTRNEDIAKLNTTVFNAETNQGTLDEISDILASPTFEQIRQVPLAGHHELSYYAREGTPEEQDMVGKYYTLTGNLIKDASRDFAGQFRKGEQQLLNGMKPSPGDTVDTAKGKTETLSVLNKMLAERSKLTSHLMSQYHINKLQALEIADKKVNGQKIRAEVHDRLHPKVTVRNKKTGETMILSASEARKLGVPNV